MSLWLLSLSHPDLLKSVASFSTWGVKWAVSKPEGYGITMKIPKQTTTSKHGFPTALSSRLLSWHHTLFCQEQSHGELSNANQDRSMFLDSASLAAFPRMSPCTMVRKSVAYQEPVWTCWKDGRGSGRLRKLWMLNVPGNWLPECCQQLGNKQVDRSSGKRVWPRQPQFGNSLWGVNPLTEGFT